MLDEFATWLEAIGLTQYHATFVANDIDLENIAELTEEDLKELGLSLGHRRTLQKRMAERPHRQDESSAPRPSPTSSSPCDLAAWERQPGERKPVTMLFADITGSTALTERLDAEEAHDLLYGAIRRMCSAVEANGGTVCRFMGDGVMAMFGAPVASEQHAIEACEAALAMQVAVSEYALEIDENDLQLRVGLHSGEVVVLTVGEGDNLEHDASGPTVPIAARMEQAANPGEIYLTAATQSLASQRIDADPLAPVSVKGITDAVPVFSLRRVRSAEEAMAEVTRTPFVGRRAELTQFRGAVATCLEEGHGQTIYVRGEPGIGKTRLVEEFAKIAKDNDVAALRGLVLPFGVGKGQDAIRSIVRGLLGIPPGGSKSDRLLAAQTALEDGRVGRELSVFLNDLLDLPQSRDQKSLYDAMDNAARNEGQHAVVAALVVEMSERQPLLVIVEDVHWADLTTLGHLSVLTKAVADCPAMLVMTSRVERDQLSQSWRRTTDGSPFVAIDLGPLREQDSVALIGEFINTNAELATNCLERAAGNPLFLEQLLRNAKEGATHSLPDSIQSLVLARMDRLDADDKHALQAASVLGQRFTAPALRHLIDDEDYNCDALIEHSLVRPLGARYLFAHALIQEGVYGSLLRQQRRELHQKTAEYFVNDLALHAQHLDSAGSTRAPRAYLEAALEQADQYRYEAAISLIDRGLTLEPKQSDWHPLATLKAELLLEMAEVEPALAMYREVEAHSTDETQIGDARMGMAACMRVMTDYHEGLALLDKCESVFRKHGLKLQLSRLHHLRGNLYFPLGNVKGCHEEHHRALGCAREVQSPEDEARALGGIGDAEYARGRMLSAFDALHKCVERCREHGFGRIEVANLSQLTNCQGHIGSVGSERAIADSLDALQAAARVSHDRAQMNALAGVCNVAFEFGDEELLRTSSEQGLALAEKLKARNWELSWYMSSALALFLRGQRENAVSMLEQAIRDAPTLSFVGAWAMGCLSMISEDRAIRAHALNKGMELLGEGSMGPNHLNFYRFAIEGCLEAGEWTEVERYARLLEHYTVAEPMPAYDFFIARGRALAKFAQGDRDQATMDEIRRLLDESNHLGLLTATPALENALSLTQAK